MVDYLKILKPSSLLPEVQASHEVNLVPTRDTQRAARLSTAQGGLAPPPASAGVAHSPTAAAHGRVLGTHRQCPVYTEPTARQTPVQMLIEHLLNARHRGRTRPNNAVWQNAAFFYFLGDKSGFMSQLCLLLQ